MFIFPKHEDFKLIEYPERHNHKADVYIQTNVLGVMKKKNAEKYQFILDQNKPKIVIEQATFRKNLDIEKPDDYFISPDDIAKEALHLVNQNKSAWTFDHWVRPYAENW